MENTPNIGLKRWEGGDRVLRAEFNDNWDKLDTALAARNCQFYTTSYVGNGDTEYTRTLTFPHRPMLVYIGGSKDFTPILSWFRGSPIARSVLGSSVSNISVTCADNAISWTYGGASFALNVKDTTYAVLALLDADN